ncbi:protein of unknown function [Paenibacillus sp. UNCCL117]|uniref:DUF1904 family protein n=1 Tax=unclassified Paenibacillus TaxID=185978 RepID=UPI0008897FD0|nr:MULTISPECIES: DUF1904 family protein [unclassified Paenibacillus]SDD92850.1 protein of unknown function [Paenibacillus sp. cl123]SFW43362.1 protein of unknown function [Paenibacillus sp. UNCCL117]
MPQLLVRGVPAETVQYLSRSLTDELAEICACGTDNFTIECISSIGIMDGEQVPSFPFVHVWWFERGQDIRDRFAQCIDRHLREAGVEESEVAFSVYQESSYYAGGKHFG